MTNTNKRALITGITGQDGSYLAELLLEKGYQVTGITRRVSVDTKERVSHILPKLKIVEGDITDGFNMRNIIEEEEPDEIYNLAAQSHVGTSFKQPSLTFDITAGGVLNILEAIRYSARKDQIRFYQASSSEMFGKNYDERDGIKYQDEETLFMPQSPYAIAKLAAHHLVRNYRDSYGIHGSCGILFNHESERRGENFVTRKITKWIGEFVAWSEGAEFGSTGIELPEHNDMVRIYGRPLNKPEFPKLRLGNLDAKRDWGHAEDYVNAMWLMLQQEDPDDYVVATGETYSVRDFLDMAFARVGVKNWNDLVVIDPEFYRPSEVDYLLGIPSKAETKLKWKRNVSFSDLANRMVDSDAKEKRL
jgi:GDPmannose 4,6-dehydratase